MKSRTETHREQPFRLAQSSAQSEHSCLKKLRHAMLEKALSLNRLEKLYSQLPEIYGDGAFLETVLQLWRPSFRVEEDEMALIPRTGPVLVVANHPFGGLEGLALATMLRRVRWDVKILASYVLHRVPELREIVIPVDPYSKQGSARANVRALATAVRWLRQGGLLVAFPAGAVSHLDLRHGQVPVPEWSTHFARMARRTDAAIQPVYFHGANSALFQVLGLVHPRVRTALQDPVRTRKHQQHVPFRLTTTPG